MIENIESFAQYQGYLSARLSGLNNIQTFRFCMGCIDRIFMLYGENVWDGLTLDEKKELGLIIQDLRESFEQETFLAQENLQQYKKTIEGFGSDFSSDAIDVLPEAIEFTSLVWWALDYCDNGKIEVACRISESLVNLKDHYVGCYYSRYSSENMFTFPAMKEELEAQERLIVAVKE